MREERLASFAPTTAHPARTWNYWLGGKDNYEADREAGDAILSIYPEIADMARLQRAFLRRVISHFTVDRGIRQFLDIGTGLPTADNTHEVAQRLAPEARVVYVDNDPIVLRHAEALLRSTPEGKTDYIEADLRDPGRILEEAARTLDFTQPVAITLLGVLLFITDDDEAAGIMRHLRDAVAPGSCLALTHTTTAVGGGRTDDAAKEWNDNSPNPMVMRTPEHIRGYVQGLELLEPGIVPLTRWRPDPEDTGSPRDIDEFCAVARKP
ncbi:SAM-dependent methyltransferase [Streptomyces sp. NPDC001843]|uniref:SAM-dependent methyltransferase n=1 Tax=Streptomyces sp. NPDC001843 TaxID=3364617 RepID=UPI00368414B5